MFRCQSYLSCADFFIAIENPKLVLIIGCVGFGLNVLVMSFLHGACGSISPDRALLTGHQNTMTMTDIMPETAMTTATATAIAKPMIKKARLKYLKKTLSLISPPATVTRRARRSVYVVLY